MLISLKKACISIKDQEDKCFKYAVQRGSLKIDENSHPTNVCHYKKTKDVLNFEAINFPANNHEVDIFEEINDSDCFNVVEVGDETGEVVLSGKLKTQTLKGILICSELLRMILVSMFV